ncbi:hypothetical protein WN48_00878 [Eufriesea mexicana]|uniref:uncharacterized protein LOC108547648 n=1 Tax=Eufriesea mexicana TaxID=516756 RepID=UPI00083BEA31|nr:PREDICTED: uncharacterized protein LOC108547648 [Eufriesea mexicana]XP_017755737.1 PREDICTED: uncharacterized protein LOC108547648 [Eufriesea mexicana]OAD58078.1 hypothetical protein WN48_00878 [Eufriesea mexicana]
MNEITNVKDNEDKIRSVFEMLKKQIDQYDIANEDIKSKEELTRSERIQKLVMQEKHLSTEFAQIRKEIKRYERKYEKVLKKKVKLMKMQIKEDQDKLKIIKQKYHELDTQIDITPYKMEKTKKAKPKKRSKPIKVKTMKPKFKQKNVPLIKKIQINIKRNEKLGKREMHFVNNTNRPNSFTDLINIVKPITMNTRECKIMLQRLTEEQMNKYVSQKRLSQQIEQKRTVLDTPQKIKENGTSTVYPNWHIKIPKSIFEESQKESDNSDKNIACSSRNVI